MNHIGQDWPRKRLMFVLEANLMKERMVRDAWLNWTTQSAMLSTKPLAKNMPHTRAFQRKLAVYRYNQAGMWERDMWQLPTVCHFSGARANEGTHDFVPWLNVSQWTMSYFTRQGMIMAYRVPHRGYGTDPHLRRGQWQHRFYKCYERDVKHLTRA